MDFLSFHPWSFSCPRSHLKYHMILVVMCPQAPLSCNFFFFLKLFLVLDDCYSLETYWSGILYLDWGLSDVLPWWHRGFRRKTTRIEFSSRHGISKMRTTNITWSSLWSPGWSHVFRFLHCEVTLVPFPYRALWKEVTTMYSPHLRTGELRSTSQKAEHLHSLNFSAQKVCSFSPFIIYLFIQSFSYVTLVDSFYSWAVIQHHYISFVPITAPALAIMSSFDWLPSPYDNIMFFQSLPLLAVPGVSGSPCVYPVQTQSPLGISFLSPLNNIPPYNNRHGLFAHSPIEGHLDCFQFWVIMNKVAIDTSVWHFVDVIFWSSWKILRSVIDLSKIIWGQLRREN